MAIPFKCPTCGATGKAGSKLVGTVSRCPKCRSMVKVGEAPPKVVWPKEVAPEPFLPPPARVASPPPPPVGPPPSALVAPAIEPARRRLLNRKWWPLIVFVSLMIGTVLMVIALFTFAPMEWEGPGMWLAVGMLGCSAIAPTVIALWQSYTSERSEVPNGHVLAATEWPVIFFGSVTFLASMHSDTMGIPWTNRLSLLAVLLAVYSKIARRIQSRKAWYAFVPLAALASFVWGRYDYAELHWSNEGSPGGRQWDYTDHQYRNAAHPFFRSIHRYGDDDDSYVSESNSGTMSESGKLHGKWIISTWVKGEYLAEDESPFREKEVWYWYCEEITEGEWHLRNK